MAAKNAMEIFALLNKSNCRECGEKTCLAFAGAVFTGRVAIERCPYLAAEERQRYRDDAWTTGDAADNGMSDQEVELLAKLKKLDLDDSANRIGGIVEGNRVVVKVLGKDFGVDQEGNCYSDIHVNPWIVGPLLLALIHGKGHEPTGRWISYREVNGGRERYELFKQRCEEDLRKIADAWPDLFRDMVETFQGNRVESRFHADVSVVLMPLPRVPVMICYWQPEEGLGSTLNFFFDETVDENLGNDGIYTLATGLSTMFTKLAQRHCG